MNKFAILFATVALLGLTSTSFGGPGQGYPEQCVDQQTNPGYAIWEVCIDLNTDDDKGRNKAKAVNAFMKVWDEVLQRWVRLRGTIAGGMAVTIMGPLGSRTHTESVSIAPPTDARFQVSDDVNPNAVSNPIWTQLSQDGANAVDATHPLPISDDLSANAVSNPLWFQISQDGANAVDATHPLPISDDLSANAVSNPMWFQISQDGANAVDATHPLPISDDLSANAVSNPMWFQISQDGANAVDATHPLPISDDLTANGVSNPIFTQLSQDGATAVGAANPLPISQDMAANALSNPIYTQLSQDGTNAVDATHPLPISDDLSANAVTNPMWFQISQDGATAVGAANPLPISQDMAANALNNPLYFQISQDGTNAVGAANPLPISDDMAANTLANTIKVELSDGAAAFLDNTSSPGYVRMQDGDSTVLQDVIDTTADGQSLAVNAEASVCTMMGYNGATLDMLRLSATKAVMTNTENWPSCYDEANGWAKTKKEEVATNAPAKETTLNIGAAATVVLAARQVLNDPNWCVYLKNVDAASAFTDADIQVSPDNTLWISLTWTTCDSLAIGTGCVYCVTGNAYNYMRVRVTGAGGSEVDVDAWYTSNKG